MSLNGTLGLGIVFSARDLASGTMLRLGRNLNFLRRQAMGTSQATTAGFAVMGVGAAILSAGMAGLSVINRVATMTGEFDMAMAQAGARARSTAGDLALMRQAALDVAASGRSVFDPTQSAQGLELLAAAGLTARESISALTPALGLATAGNISVESSSRALVSALRVFSLGADQSEQVANQMLAISNSTLLEARDLEAAMGAVGRGAVQAGQSIREMLPAMGLVRNSGVSAEVAAHAVSSSLIYMSTHARDRFNDLGVSLTDATGQFRPFLDIVFDTNEALRGVTDQAERAEQVNRLFGRFGMTAFSAISAQLGAGIRSQLTGELLTGAAAIAELRRQMDAAGGTIDYFLDRTLNTLPGQLQVLKAVASSIAVEMGTPLAAALKPAIAALVGLLQRFRAAWSTLPDGFKTGIVRAFLLASAFLTFLGSATLVIGAVVLLLPFLKVLAITMGVIGLLVLPIAAGLIAAAGAVYLFARAVNENVGGLNRLRTAGERVVLFFRALHAIFSEGGFSGALRRDLNRAENAGVRRFALQVGAVIYRVQRFFEGVSKGVAMFLREAAPEMRRFLRVIERLGMVLGLTGDMLGGITKQSSKTFGEAGLGMGHSIVRMFARMVDTLSDIIKTLELVAGGFRDGFGNNFVIDIVIGRLSAMWESLTTIIEALTGVRTEMNLAGMVGWTAGVLLSAIFGALAVILLIVIVAFGIMVAGFVIGAVLMTIALLPLIITVGILLAGIWAVVSAWRALRGQPPITLADLTPDALRNVGTGPATLIPSGGPVGAVPAGPDRRAPARPLSGPVSLDPTTGTGLTQSAEGDAQLVARLTEAINNRPPPPVVNTSVVVDGEVLARAVQRATVASDNRSFGTPGSGES